MEPSLLVLDPLRTVEEFALYRGERSNQQFTISSPAGSSVYEAGPGDLKKVRERILVEGRTGLQLGSRPLVLSRQRGQTPLVLEDVGGETLVRFLPGPMEITQFLINEITIPGGHAGYLEQPSVMNQVGTLLTQ